MGIFSVKICKYDKNEESLNENDLSMIHRASI